MFDIRDYFRRYSQAQCGWEKDFNVEKLLRQEEDKKMTESFKYLPVDPAYSFGFSKKGYLGGTNGLK